MSVTSATDFSEGPELFDQEKYWSKISISVEPDPQTIDQEFRRSLKDRISGPIGMTGKYAHYRLDDVDVRAPADAFRQHEVNQWAQAKKAAEDKQWAWSTTAITCTLLAIVVGAVAWNANSPLAAAISVASAVAGVVSTFFISAAKSAITKTSEQINRWGESPVMKIGIKRNYAHERGFPYIYANNLKLGREPSYTALFHPKQVEHEYKKYFKSFCETMLAKSCSSCKATWMEKFFTSNPLSSQMMKYGLGEVPGRMTQVSADYDRLGSFFADIKKSYDDLKNRVTDLAKERIEIYNRERTTKLQPHVDARNAAVAAAKANLDKLLKQYPLATDHKNLEARKNFEGIKKALDEDYAGLVAPINKNYDGMIQEIEKDLKARIQKLDDQKVHQMTNNYNAARDLLARADQAWEGQAYQQVNFQYYFPWQSPLGQPVYPIQPPRPVVYRPEQKIQHRGLDYQQQPPVRPMYQQQSPVQRPSYEQPIAPIYPQVDTGYVEQPGYPQSPAPPYKQAEYLPQNPMNPYIAQYAAG